MAIINRFLQGLNNLGQAKKNQDLNTQQPNIPNSGGTIDFKSMSDDQLNDIIANPNKYAPQTPTQPTKQVIPNIRFNPLRGLAGALAGASGNETLMKLATGQGTGTTGEDLSSYEAKKRIDKQYETPKTPIIKSIGKTLVQVNPETGEVETLMEGEKELSALQQIKKDQRTQDLINLASSNQLKRGYIDKALTDLPKIPQGLKGKLAIDYMKNFDPSNPVLSNWQNLKSLLTDMSLLSVAETKGAISDKEMKLFMTSAANDDLVSVARMGSALQRLRNHINTEEEASRKSYKAIYGENPDDFIGWTLPTAEEKKSNGEVTKKQSIPKKSSQTKYTIGQVIDTPNGKVKITGGDLNNDPDIELIK